jgi:hypothetical protein
LDDAIMAGIQIHKEFKKSNRLDIVNTVFLTDGDSHPIEAKIRSTYDGMSDRENVRVWDLYGRDNVVKFIDTETKKQYRLTGRFNSTKTLLQMFRDNTGSNAIGYRIVTLNKRALYSDFRDLGYEGVAQLHNDLKKNKFTTLPNYGYTEFFAIAGGKNLETSNGAIEVPDDAKVGAIRTAFKRANANRKTSRVLLSKFIDLVA